MAHKAPGCRWTLAYICIGQTGRSCYHHNWRRIHIRSNLAKKSYFKDLIKIHFTNRRLFSLICGRSLGLRSNSRRRRFGWRVHALAAEHDLASRTHADSGILIAAEMQITFWNRIMLSYSDPPSQISPPSQLSRGLAFFNALLVVVWGTDAQYPATAT